MDPIDAEIKKGKYEGQTGKIVRILKIEDEYLALFVTLNSELRIESLSNLLYGWTNKIETL